ncbi:hypothetical protein FIBSPDRAFT_737825, partial [Athelia psychrophila]
QCKGYLLTFPHGESAHSSYPFMLHHTFSLPWDYEHRNGIFALRAHGCREAGSINGSCKECVDLRNDQILIGIQDRITQGVREGSNYSFYGLGGLTEIGRRKEGVIQTLRLRRLNDARKLVGREGALDDAKRILFAVASRKVPRMNIALQNAFARNMSLHAMLDLINRAAEGTYHPKSFDDEDDARGMLMLILGGGRVADIAHHAYRSPAASTLRRHDTTPPILASPSQPTLREVEQNINACFESISDLLPSSGVVHAEVMFDELAVEKRPRWDDRTNKILGFCHGCSDSGSLDFNSSVDLDTLFDDLDRGEIDLASEATVRAIGMFTPEPRLYSARPILISGTCKKENATEHLTLIKMALNAINNKKSLTHIHVICVGSDGEAKRGKAFIGLTYKSKLSPLSNIHESLSGLSLMDLWVGDDDLTANKDLKHIMKRLCSALLREKGIWIRGVHLTPQIIQIHLRDEGFSPLHIRSMFKPSDLQDIPLAFNLLKDIWSLPSASPAANPAYTRTREALRIYAAICYHVTFPYVCVDLSLAEQLEHLSCAAHLALSVFSVSDSQHKMAPTPLYIDIMLMIKNVYFSIAKAKVDTPNIRFFIILLGTDRLETLFGILRTMIGNDANLDIYQLALRLTGSTKVANILAKHPEWDKGPRRLRLPLVSKDMKKIPEGADHINPGAWRSTDLFVKSVTLSTHWKRGRRSIEDRFPWAAPVLADTASNPEATILAPNGTQLFDLPFDNDDCEEDIDEVPVYCTTAGGNSEGLTRLEDAAADAESHSSDPTRLFERTVTVNGKPMDKARELALRYRSRYDKTAASTDRLRRVQQEDRYKTTADAETYDIECFDGPCLSVLDPIVSLVHCEGKLFLAFGEVTNIHIQSSSIGKVPLELLPENTVRVSYQMILLAPANIEQDPSERHDWCSSRALPYHFKAVPGIMIQPVNPDTSTTSPGDPRYLFDSGTLRSLSSSLQDRLTRSYLLSIPKAAVSSEFPYRSRTGMHFVVCLC